MWNGIGKAALAAAVAMAFAGPALAAGNAHQTTLSLDHGKKWQPTRSCTS